MFAVPPEWYGQYGLVRLAIKTWITQVLVGMSQRSMCWYTSTDRYLPTR